MNKKNTGDNNTGNYNTGDENTGYYNTGNGNTGSHNTGYYNTGSRNTSYYNSGSYNSGSYNSGKYNSGKYNSGIYNTGYFNTNEPAVRLFNKDTDKKRDEIIIPYIHLPICEWRDGALIRRTYHEAWAIAWAGASDVIKQQFLDLPNFDAEIFKEITGIDVNQ